MAPWVANAIGLALGVAVVGLWALALLWRVGSWHIPAAATLTHDEGLRIGSTAPEIACHTVDGSDRHLSFAGRPTFVVFGKEKCRHCQPLLHAAGSHPATRQMRLVYLTDSNAGDLDPDLLGPWETYEYADERAARHQWRVPVSPYFHVIDSEGRIIEKGVASESPHLDRLLALRPGALARTMINRTSAI